jgi:hypothetical protein
MGFPTLPSSSPPCFPPSPSWVFPRALERFSLVCGLWLVGRGIHALLGFSNMTAIAGLMTWFGCVEHVSKSYVRSSPSSSISFTYIRYVFLRISAP